METRRAARINKLTQALKNGDRLHLKQAAELLGVSEMTVRRDLNATSASVILLGGYVVNDPQSNAIGHYFVSDQQNQHVQEKRVAGHLAAQLVEAGDTVFFDCGTTLPFLIDAIDEELPFTAVCYSLNTFLALQAKPAAKVILCGGEFHPDNAIFTPLTRQSELDPICTNKAFISAAGVDLKRGATCFNFAELDIKHRAMSLTQRTILVADNSKFGRIQPATISALTQFDTLVTDSAPHGTYQDFALDNGIMLIYSRC